MRYFENQFNDSDINLCSEILLDVLFLSDEFKDLKKKKLRSIGVDFPVLLSRGSSKPTLMICAMDPLRRETINRDWSTVINFWVPFSIINNPSLEPKYSERENLLFFHTLLASYNIYVTDIFKIFYREGTRVSNTDKVFKGLAVHREILAGELQIIRPEAILTLGNSARDAMCELLGMPVPQWGQEPIKNRTSDGMTVLMVPHISGAANGAKAPILNNPDYEGVPGVRNEKYANIILQVLKDSQNVRV